MVIQRIQPLMLLIAAILMAIFCCTGFATVGAARPPPPRPRPAAPPAPARTVLVADAPVLLTLNILIAALLVISIFLYRDLRRQMRVTLLILLLICASMVTSGFIIYAGIPGAEPILLGGVSLLLLALIFALLAYRAMGRDRRLLAAADRLR